MARLSVRRCHLLGGILVLVTGGLVPSPSTGEVTRRLRPEVMSTVL
jgi:hypothetical protein